MKKVKTVKENLELQNYIEIETERGTSANEEGMRRLARANEMDSLLKSETEITVSLKLVISDIEG